MERDSINGEHKRGDRNGAEMLTFRSTWCHTRLGGERNNVRMTVWEGERITMDLPPVVTHCVGACEGSEQGRPVVWGRQGRDDADDAAEDVQSI